MGEDYWPYGVSANRNTLEAQLQWIWLDGLQARRITLEDLFPPVFPRNTLDCLFQAVVSVAAQGQALVFRFDNSCHRLRCG